MQEKQMPLWDKFRIKSEYLKCFAAAVGVGMFTHLMVISNKLTNWDDVACLPGIGMGEFGGRWLQVPLHEIFSKWSGPNLNGAMAVVFYAAAICVIIDMLQIRSELGRFAAILLFMSFPSVASSMLYMYLTPLFALAVLLMAVSAWLTARTRWGFIPSINLIVAGMALYQGYFSIVTSLLVMAVLIAILEGEACSSIIRESIKYLLTLGFSMALYLFRLKQRGLEIVDYKGMNSIGEGGIGQLARAILRTYHRLLQYFALKPESFMEGLATRLNAGMLVLLVLLAAAVFVLFKLYREWLRALLYAAVLIVLPVALALVYVMAQETEHASTMMTFSYGLIYLLVILLLERVCERLQPLGKQKSFRLPSVLFGDRQEKNITLNPGKAAAGILFAGGMALLLVIGYADLRIDNIAYYRSYTARQRVDHLYNRVWTRLEEQEGFAAGQKVFMMGEFPETEKDTDSTIYLMDRELFNDFEGLCTEEGYFLKENRIHYLRLYFGVNVTEPTLEEMEAMKSYPEYLSMPLWPEEGCIRQIGDAWVVRMGE